MSVIDVGMRVQNVQQPPGLNPHPVTAVCLGWLLLYGVSERVRRARLDPCVDVLSWLFPIKREVYEVRGVQFQIFGWISPGPQPMARVVALAQNCHRGERSLILALLPKKREALEGDGPFYLSFELKDAEAVAIFDSRPLRLREGVLEFDFKAQVQVQRSGWRVRFRHGFSPKSKWVEPAMLVASIHSPLHGVIHMATHRKHRDDAPVTLVAQQTPDPLPWPQERVHTVWDAKNRWVLSGASKDWMCLISQPYGDAVRSGGELPKKDGQAVGRPN